MSARKDLVFTPSAEQLPHIASVLEASLRGLTRIPPLGDIAMSSLNKAQLIGNLGRDPEVRYTSNGTAVCNVSIATTSAWKDKAGERVEETEWHRVVFYDRLAEIVGEYLRKGRSIYVEGRLRTRKWDDKEGVGHYATEIIASDMQMLGTKPDDAKRIEGKNGDHAMPATAPIVEDDIPF